MGSTQMKVLYGPNSGMGLWIRRVLWLAPKGRLRLEPRRGNAQGENPGRFFMVSSFSALRRFFG
jgi:hypothetical protein